MAYGYITSANDYKQQLKNLNRNYEGRKTWNALYGAVDLQGQHMKSQVKSEYSQDMLDTYKQAYDQSKSLNNSSLLSGYKNYAQDELNNQLYSAYDAYRQNYAQNLASVNESIASSNMAIDSALETEATNVKKYQDSLYGYFTDLVDRAYGQGNYDTADDNLLNALKEAGLYGYITHNDGTSALMSSEELYSKIYDSERNLTPEGIALYENLMDTMGIKYGPEYGFNSYLANTDNELYQWSQALNPYDYTEAGTNVGTVRTLLGLPSSYTPKRTSDEAEGNGIYGPPTPSGYEAPSKPNNHNSKQATKPEAAKSQYYNVVMKAYNKYDADSTDSKNMLTYLDNAYKKGNLITEQEYYDTIINSFDRLAAKGTDSGVMLNYLDDALKANNITETKYRMLYNKYIKK